MQTDLISLNDLGLPYRFFNTEAMEIGKRSGLFHWKKQGRFMAAFISPEMEKPTKTLFSLFGDYNKFKKAEPVIATPPQFSPGGDQSLCMARVEENKNLLIKANPGTGKTTLASFLSFSGWGPALYLTFSRASAKDLEKKIKSGNRVSTFHALCMGAYKATYKGAKISEWKIHNLAEKLVKEKFEFDLDTTEDDEDRVAALHIKGLKVAAGLALNNMVLPDDEEGIFEMVQKYRNNICFWKFQGSFDFDFISFNLPALLREMDKNRKQISFDELLFYCAVDSAIPIFKQSKILIDESQDVNPAQMALVKRMKPDQLVAVGQEEQSIYGFRGADHNAMSHLEKEFKMEVAGLNETRRLPKSIADHVNSIYGTGIKSLKDGGSVNSGEDPSDIHRDMILCRRRSTCVDTVFSLLAREIPAVFKGSEIDGQILAPVIQGAKEYGDDLSEIAANLDEGDDEESNDLSKIVKRLCSESSSLCDYIANMHKVTHADKAIQVRTGHGAKGLEADRVWVVRKDGQFKVSFANQTEDESVQERNLEFVAETRSKESLNEINL